MNHEFVLKNLQKGIENLYYAKARTYPRSEYDMWFKDILSDLETLKARILDDQIALSIHGVLNAPSNNSINIKL